LALALLAEWFDPHRVLAARPRILVAFVSRKAAATTRTPARSSNSVSSRCDTPLG
jgi:hypothetical protein